MATSRHRRRRSQLLTWDVFCALRILERYGVLYKCKRVLQHSDAEHHYERVHQLAVVRTLHEAGCNLERIVADIREQQLKMGFRMALLDHDKNYGWVDELIWAILTVIQLQKAKHIHLRRSTDKCLQKDAEENCNWCADKTGRQNQNKFTPGWSFTINQSINPGSQMSVLYSNTTTGEWSSNEWILWKSFTSGRCHLDAHG